MLSLNHQNNTVFDSLLIAELRCEVISKEKEQDKKEIQNEKHKRQEKKEKRLSAKNEKVIWIRKTLVIMLVFLLIIYFILRIVYDTGRFTITLDSAGDPMSGIIIYEHLEERKSQQTLEAEDIDFFTNISGDWIPKNIANEAEGSHNGNNYIAYTFYIENVRDNTINYWYEIIFDDVIKNVDEALRVMVILNDEKTVYAKLNSTTQKPEANTTAFFSEEKVAVACRENLKSKEVDKCTVVIWIEGDDPECIDDLIGGEIKMHMKITEEHIAQEN